jgi:hypothetical protein
MQSWTDRITEQKGISGAITEHLWADRITEQKGISGAYHRTFVGRQDYRTEGDQWRLSPNICGPTGSPNRRGSVSLSPKIFGPTGSPNIGGSVSLITEHFWADRITEQKGISVAILRGIRIEKDQCPLLLSVYRIIWTSVEFSDFFCKKYHGYILAKGHDW